MEDKIQELLKTIPPFDPATETIHREVRSFGSGPWKGDLVFSMSFGEQVCEEGLIDFLLRLRRLPFHPLGNPEWKMLAVVD